MMETRTIWNEQWDASFGPQPQLRSIEPTRGPVKSSRPLQIPGGGWQPCSGRARLVHDICWQKFLELIASLCINEGTLDTVRKWLDPDKQDQGDGKASPLLLAGLLAQYGVMEELDTAQLAAVLAVEHALAVELAALHATRRQPAFPAAGQRTGDALATLCTRLETAHLHFESTALARAMLGMLQDAGDLAGRHRLACELALRHLENGRTAETQQWRELAAATLDDAADSSRLLRFDAFAALYAGDAGSGLALLQRATALAAAEGDLLLQAKLNGDMGSVLMMLGLNQQAISAFDLSLRQLQQSGEQRSEATALANIGILRHRNGQLSEARRMYERSLALALHLQDSRLEMNARQYLGKLLLDIGKTELAREEYMAVLEHAQSEGELMNQAVALEGLGNVERMLKRHDAARECYAKCLAVCAAGGMHGQEFQVRVHLALLQLLNGQVGEALDDLHHILERMDCEENPSEFAYARMTEGEAMIANAEFDLATDVLREAAELFSELGEHIFEGAALCQLAKAHHQAGEEHAARDAQARADALYEALGRPENVDFDRRH